MTITNSNGTITVTAANGATVLATLTGANWQNSLAGMVLTDSDGSLWQWSPATQSFATYVSPAPVLNKDVANGLVNDAFSYQINATGATSYNATSLPVGLTVNTTTGLISGTPTATGETVATMSATNAGGTTSATLRIFIAATV